MKYSELLKSSKAFPMTLTKFCKNSETLTSLIDLSNRTKVNGLLRSFKKRRLSLVTNLKSIKVRVRSPSLLSHQKIRRHGLSKKERKTTINSFSISSNTSLRSQPRIISQQRINSQLHSKRRKMMLMNGMMMLKKQVMVEEALRKMKRRQLRAIKLDTKLKGKSLNLRSKSNLLLEASSIMTHLRKSGIDSKDHNKYLCYICVNFVLKSLM